MREITIIYTEQRIVKCLTDNPIFKEGMVISNQGCIDEDDYQLNSPNGLEYTPVSDELREAIDELTNKGEIDWTTSRSAVMGNFMIDSISVEKAYIPKLPFRLWDKTYSKMSFLEVCEKCEYPENYIWLSPTYVLDTDYNRIYEGDVVEIDRELFEVVFDREWKLRNIEKKYVLGIKQTIFEILSFSKIRGNIYQNKNLLNNDY